jgi:drug/metabolite transporter (DMT)-like permease
VLAAIHIISIDHFSKKSKDNFTFNVFQSFWTALFALLFAGIDSRWSLMSMNFHGWIGIVSLGLGSSLIAFYLQVRAQQKLSPSVASILFLLESPFTLFFAYWLLGDRLTGSQLVGAALIIIACTSAILMKTRSKVLYKI